MKESDIRKKAIKELKEMGWVFWYPPKVKWIREGDIFGVFDIVCWWKGYLRFIQLTSDSNIRAREKKVRNFLSKNNLIIPKNVYIDIFGWNKKKKQFRIIKI